MAYRPIDDDAYTADESGAGWVPVYVRDNLAEIAENRRLGASWAAVQASQDSPRSVRVSTPSDTWLALPLLIAVDDSTTEISLSLRYTCADAPVDVRLACDGLFGSATNLATTGSATTVTLTVAHRPRPGVSEVALELQIRSERLAGVVDSVNIDGMTPDGAQWTATGISGGVSTGVTHYECEVTEASPGGLTGRTNYHVGHIEHSGGNGTLYVWPAWDLTFPRTGDTATGDLYTVGSITVLGLTYYCGGQLVRGLPQSIGAPGAPTSSSLWSQAWAVLGGLYRRPRVWCAMIPGDGATTQFGRDSAASSVCAAALCERRQDARGVRVTLWALPYTGDAATVTVRIYGSDGTEETTEAATITVTPIDGTPSGDDPGASTAAWFVRSRSGGTMSGTRDLAYPGEATRPDPRGVGWVAATVEVAWPAGVSVGELARVTAEFDIAAHVRGALIREVY